MFRNRVDAAFARFQRRGNPADLARVFDATSADLLRVARHLVGDVHTAEDIVQATFVAAIEHRDRYAPPRPVAAWLHGILANQAKRHHERLCRAPDPARLGTAVDAAAATIAEQRELTRAVDDAIARLPEAYQPVLRLHLTRGLSAAEIALALARAPDTVHKQISRGLERLRRLLPIGLASLFAGLALPPRGLAQVRREVLAAAQRLAPAGATLVAAAALTVGGWWMKQFLMRAGTVVVVLLLGWSGLEIARGGAPTPPSTNERTHPLAAATTASPEGPTAGGREAIAAPPPVATGVVFVGRCVAADSGAPLDGVPVTVWREATVRAEPTAIVGSATSATGGAFRCECQPSEAAVLVRIGGKDFVPHTGWFGPYTAARVVELGDVPLGAGINLTTLVVDRAGAPVADVVVLAALGQPRSRERAVDAKSGVTANSDAHGRIVWPQRLQPGRYRIAWETAWALPYDRQSAWMEVHAEPGVQENVLIWPLEDVTHTIRGRVVDEHGDAVAELDLGAEGGGTRGNAETRADGSFVMPRVGPFDPGQRGPVYFGLPRATEGYELVGEPTCRWGDDDVRLVVRAAATLVVRAVDATTGETIRDVHVACAVRRDDGGLPAVAWVRPQTCSVQPDGSVRRRLARCVHDVQVFAKDPRYAASPKLVWDPGVAAELVVPLAPVRTGTVRVVTADGQPVPGTDVWTLLPIEAAPGAPAIAGWREVAALPVPDELRLEPTTRWARHGIDDAPLGNARTDAAGRARVALPADTDVVVAALGPGHVAKAVVGRADDAEIELVVARGATIRLDLTPREVARRLAPSPAALRLVELGVRDADAGARGVELRIRRVTGEDPNLWRSVATASVDNAGECVQTGLPPGTYGLTLTNHMQAGPDATALVYWPFARVTVADGEELKVPVDVSRWATGRLRATVLVNGRPWAFGTGSLTSHPGTPGVNPGDTSVQIATDGRGCFEVELPQGDYRLRMIYRSGGGNVGYWFAAERHAVVAGSTGDAVFTARYVDSRVRIVRPNGTPATGLTVTMDCAAEPKGWQSWTTDTDGWISIEQTPTVPFTLLVHDPEGPPRPDRRRASQGDAVLGPFQVPPIGARAEFRASLPESWR